MDCFCTNVMEYLTIIREYRCKIKLVVLYCLILIYDVRKHHPSIVDYLKGVVTDGRKTPSCVTLPKS